MRLSVKLNLAILLVVCSVLGFQSQQRVNRELALFEDEIRRDHHVMGRVLRHAVEDERADSGEGAARALVARVNQREEGVTIRWVDLGVPGEEPAAPEHVLAAVAEGRDAEHVDHSRPPGMLYTYVPLGPTEAIEIGETLADQQAYTQLTIRRGIGWLAILSIVTWLAGVVLVRWLVGRPVARLTAHARRVGSGDLRSRVGSLAPDELGELGNELDQMARALDDAQHKLRHADRLMTIGQLAAGVAHELGTPLNVAQARARMIESWDVDSVEEARQSAKIVTEQCERMAVIIRQLLDFARPRKLERSERDLRRVVERTLQLVTPMARRRGVALEMHDGPPAVIPIDMAQLEQVVSNLVVNALAATPADGRVDLRVDPPAVVTPPERTGLARGEYARLTVRDTGTGIAPEHLPHVFEPFFTTKDLGEGTGLGLSVSHGIVRDHGGWIDLESEPGKGTAFHVWLPRESP